MTTIGILHPGAMGSSLGGALVGNGFEVVWSGQGRSIDSTTRAARDGLREVGTVEDLAADSDVIVSCCPPAAALEVADQVAATAFDGLYVDANAVAPDTARMIASRTETAGATFVDGGIVGPPARHKGLTVLYLSGPPAAVSTVESLFEGSPVDTHAVDGPPGAASATKMAFAAWTKGTSALLLAIRALAEQEGVVAGLDHAWSRLSPELAERLPATVRGTAPKAWRFEGEMKEIAATFAGAGLPDGFHLAAAEIYRRLADLRDLDEVAVDDAVARLTDV